MAASTKKSITNSGWILIMLCATCLNLPHNAMAKVLSEYLGPVELSLVRYGLVSLVLMPFFIWACVKHWPVIKKQLWMIALISLPLAFGGLAHQAAVTYSSATFVSVLGLLTPIVFAIASVVFTKDQISRNAIVGLLMAILGGSIVMILPPLLGNANLAFGWLPILLMSFNIFCAVLWQIARRKQDEAQVPMSVIIIVPYIMSSIVMTMIIALDPGGYDLSQVANLPLWVWAMIAYLAIVLSALIHALSTKVYEKLGTATMASLDYVYYILAPVVPMILIGEAFSWEVGIGAALIIAGIIMTRKHHQHRRHHHGVHP